MGAIFEWIAAIAGGLVNTALFMAILAIRQRKAIFPLACSDKHQGWGRISGAWPWRHIEPGGRCHARDDEEREWKGDRRGEF